MTRVPIPRVLCTIATLIFMGAFVGSTLQGAAAEDAKGPDAVMSVTTDRLVLQAREDFEPIPLDPPAVEGIVATPALVHLGKVLFFDPRLSANNTVSCASCHDPSAGGSDSSPFSTGVRGGKGSRNAPTVFNAVYNFVQFWDGRAATLTDQAGGPIENPLEMGSSRAVVISRLGAIAGYRPLFEAAFPGQAEPITFDNVKRALAAFEATLVTPNAPFDRFLRGDPNALTADQKSGLRLFTDHGCIACHTARNVGGAIYQKFGVNNDPGPQHRPASDKGRGAVSGDPAEEYFFKVPSLRNITRTAPYFHRGSEPELRAAIKLMGEVQLDLQLEPREIDQIAAFLQSLEGERPQIAKPELPN